MSIVALLVGIIIGIVISVAYLFHGKAGSLLIDLVNPMNDKPFLLELNKHLDDVCNKRYIVLKIVVSHK